MADLATLTRNSGRFGDNLPTLSWRGPPRCSNAPFDLLGVALAP